MLPVTEDHPIVEPPKPPRRKSIVLASAALLLLLMVIIVVLSVLGITHTGYGREKVRSFITSRLKDKVHGKMYIGRITGGFFTGVEIDSLEIRDPEDSLFVATGPIRVLYDVRDIIDRRILIKDIEIFRPNVYLRQHESGLWNWRQIFPSSPKKPRSPERGFGDFIVINSATVHEGEFTLTMPWHPSDYLKGYQRDSATRFVLADTIMQGHRTSEGIARTWRWRRINADLGYIRLADRDSIGRAFTVNDLDVDESYPPFKFSNIKGMVKHLGDSVWADVAHFDLPGSRGSAKGKVVWGSNLPARYDIRVRGDSVSLRDVAWIYPTLPRTGGGKASLHIINDKKNLKVMDYVISNMDVRTTGSRLEGQMTFSTGNPVLVVKDVKLTAAPVDFDLLRTFNGEPFPFDWQGKFTGTVNAPGGPLTNFKVADAKFTYYDKRVPGATSFGSAAGELNILEPAFTEFHNFNVTLGQLDLRTIQSVNPEFPEVKGTVSGVATLDSSWLDVRFKNANLVHRDGTLPLSTVTGSGRVTWGEQYLTYYLDLQAAPVSFTTLANSYPGLPLRGYYTGPIRVRGQAPALEVETNLTGPGGAVLAFNGVVDADPFVYGARGKGTFLNANLNSLLEKATFPVTDLNGEYAVDITTDTLLNLAGSVTLDLRGSKIRDTKFASASTRLRFENNLALIDTLSVVSSLGDLAASGTVGLKPGYNGSLRFSLISDSLSRLLPAVGAIGEVGIYGTLSGNADSMSASVKANSRTVQADLEAAIKTAKDGASVYVSSAVVNTDVAGNYRLLAPANLLYTASAIVLDSLLVGYENDGTNARLAVRNLQLVGDSIRGSLRTDGFTMRMLETLNPSITNARGSITANLDVTGTLKRPNILGQVVVSNGGFRLKNLGTQVDSINADIVLASDTISVRKLEARSGKATDRGSLSVAGFISLADRDNPYLSLTANTRNFRFVDKAGLASLEVSTRRPITLQGPYNAAVVRGSVLVDQGSIYIPEMSQKKLVNLNDPELYDIVDTTIAQNRTVLPKAPSKLAQNLRLENVSIDLGGDVWVRSSEANIKLGGSLGVTLGGSSPTGEQSQLALEGTLNAERGTYRLMLVDPFVQPTFEVSSGTLRFYGTPELNPALDIKAIHTIRQGAQTDNAVRQDIRVRVTIGGTLSRPTLLLDNPDNLPLSQSDLLSYMITGQPAVALNADNREYLNQALSIATRWGGTVISSAIPRNLLDIVELQTAGIGVRPGAQTVGDPYLNNLLNTRAVLGKQLSDKLFVGLSTGLCFNDFASNLGVKFEYRFSSMYSAQVGIEPGTANLGCASPESASTLRQQTPQQFGIDFFRTWRY